jgi:replicative DNA helicase
MAGKQVFVMEAKTITMPSSLDTERSVLGGLLLDPKMWAECKLDDAVFYDAATRRIYKAMSALHSEGVAADLVMTHQRMEADGSAQFIGGLMGLVSLTEGIVSRGESLVKHTDSLRDLANRRTVITKARELAAQAADTSTDLGDAWSQGRKTLDETLGESSVPGQRPAEYVGQWLENCEKLQHSAAVSVPVPYNGLAQLSTGLFPGELIILAARPGVGKTALALNLLEYALASGVPCGMFSLEMNKFLLLNRLAAAREQIDATRFRDGQFSDEDWSKLHKYADLVSGYPLRTWDQSWLRPRDLRAQCRAWKKEIGLRFAVVDYLQLCRGDQRGGGREQEVAEISRTCKEIAGELDIAMLVLCQLNRESEKTKKPLLSQLRESGSIEQDADQVIFLVPPGGSGTSYDSDVVEVEGVVAKNRNSQTGSFRLMYHRKHVLFADADRY